MFAPATPTANAQSVTFGSFFQYLNLSWANQQLEFYSFIIYHFSFII